MKNVRTKNSNNPIDEFVRRPQPDKSELLNWLEFSWFYPEGFNKRLVLKGRESYLVLGDGLAYKFLLGKSESKLQRANLEIQLNRDLAPDLYLGLRMLRWINSEPHWMTEKAIAQPDKISLPQDIDDVAIVMRKLPKGMLMSSIVASGRKISDKKIYKLVKLIKNYQSKRKREGLKVALAEKNNLPSSFKARWDHDLSMVAGTDQLGNFFRVVNEKVKTALEDFFSCNSNYLLRRSLKGNYIQLHGDLRAKNISLAPLCTEGRDISVFGRRAMVFGDVLEDVSELYVDLISLGAQELADNFIESYFEGQSSRAERKLFRLIVAIKSMARVRLFELGQFKEKLDTRALLSNAFKSILSINSPLVVCICDANKQEIPNYGDVFSAFLDGEKISGDNQGDNFIEENVQKDQSFIKLLARINNFLALKKNLVLQATHNSAEHRMSIQRTAANNGAEVIFLKVNKNPKKIRSDDSNIFGFANVLDEQSEQGVSPSILIESVSGQYRWLQVSELLAQVFNQ